jgi:hypothetical protein
MELQIDLDCPTPLEGSEHEFLGKKDANLMSFLHVALNPAVILLVLAWKL